MFVRSSDRWQATGRTALALISVGVLLLLVTIIWRSPPETRPAPGYLGSAQLFQSAANSTLVVYILSAADVVHIENFRFFYYEAILRDSNIRYEILITKRHQQETALPALPSHAQYVEHDALCHGLGLVRWHLVRRAPDGIQQYILLSSAVRGPFIPPGLRGLMQWSAPVLADLGPNIALTGGVISCAQQPADELQEQPLLPPFPEFTVIAANQAGIGALLALPSSQLPGCSPPDGAAAAPHPDAERQGAHTDPGAVIAGDGMTGSQAEALMALRSWSSAVLGSGWGLSSLAVRQAGVDWRDNRTWGCNGGISPLTDAANDGLSLSPYEAYFLPVSMYDDSDMPHGSPSEVARSYTEWMQATDWNTDAENTTVASPRADGGGAPPAGVEGGEDGHNVTGAGGLNSSSADADADAGGLAPLSRAALIGRNRFYTDGNPYKLPAVLMAVASGEQCLDVAHFKKFNPDVAELTDTEAWKLYVFVAQFQPRPFRVLCGVDWNKYGLKNASGPRRGGSAPRNSTARRPRPRRLGAHTFGQEGAVADIGAAERRAAGSGTSE